jgi:hypothetical protein
MPSRVAAHLFKQTYRNPGVLHSSIREQPFAAVSGVAGSR